MTTQIIYPCYYVVFDPHFRQWLEVDQKPIQGGYLGPWDQSKTRQIIDKLSDLVYSYSDPRTLDWYVVDRGKFTQSLILIKGSANLEPHHRPFGPFTETEAYEIVDFLVN